MPVRAPELDEVRVFPTRADFRGWLEEHHASADALFVGYYRKGVQKAAMTYVEAVEEALCFGWIDGITYRVHAELTATRFTPRRPRSGWSATNLERMARLMATGRVRPAGLEVFEGRDRRRDGVTLAQLGANGLPGELESRLRADTAAWTHWESETPSYRRNATAWILEAKRPETIERRFGELLAASRSGTRPRPFLVTRDQRAARDVQG
ncbi:MAG TPA: YdeI/OmpD-associated family protein [Candidatus Limnocylindria bacterium]